MSDPVKPPINRRQMRGFIALQPSEARRYIFESFKANRGRISYVARAFDVSVPVVHRWIAALGMAEDLAAYIAAGKVEGWVSHEYRTGRPKGSRNKSYKGPTCSHKLSYMVRAYNRAWRAYEAWERVVKCRHLAGHDGPCEALVDGEPRAFTPPQRLTADEIAAVKKSRERRKRGGKRQATGEAAKKRLTKIKNFRDRVDRRIARRGLNAPIPEDSQGSGGSDE